MSGCYPVVTRRAQSGAIDWTPELSRAVRDLRAKGVTYREIAAQIGVSHGAVARHVQRCRKARALREGGAARLDVDPGQALVAMLEGRSAGQAWRLRCAVAFGVSEAALLGRSRAHDVVVARAATCFVLRERLGLSYAQIGALIGGRDHSTIISAVIATKGRIARDAALAARISGLIGASIGREPYDAHVRQWRAAKAARAASSWRALDAGLGVRPRPVDPAGELAEFLEQDDLLWCGQCDCAVRDGERRACQSRFCPLRAPLRLGVAA